MKRYTWTSLASFRGPLPISQGFLCLLACVEQFTQCSEATPIEDIAVETVAYSFVTRWISLFGYPSAITTACRCQFESAFFVALARFIGARHINTMACHSPANRMVERHHWQIKASLTVREDRIHWVDHLLLVLLGT